MVEQARPQALAPASALCLLTLAIDAEARAPAKIEVELLYSLTITEINDKPPRGGPLKREVEVEGSEITSISISEEEVDEGKRYV